MNRNASTHFAETPSLNIGRSKFDKSFTHKTTFNAGEIVPIMVDEVLPGDTIKMNMSEVVRMMTPIAPVMDNAELTLQFYFVPNRLLWDHWQEFMGENKTAPWIQRVEYEIPQVTAPAETGWTKGSLADHMGFPTNIPGYEVSALPFRAYALIYNEWWRSEVLSNPLYISTGDATLTGVDILDANLDPITDIEAGACCAKAARTPDYFSMALPDPQRGPAVNIPLGTTAPIVGGETGNPPDITIYPTQTGSVGSPVAYQKTSAGAGSKNMMIYDDGEHGWQEPAAGYGFTLQADLSQAVAATVAQLRQAFAIQKFYERQAIGGTRYIEVIKSHYSVTNPDFRFQRPEFLGGVKTPININQVVQTDSTAQQLTASYVDEELVWSMEDLSPQGNTAAYSLTAGKNSDMWTHSFTEHGIVMGLACVRLTNHSFQQGLNRMWSRKRVFDYYWPEFANLSNQGIKNKEIYMQAPTVVDDDGKVINEKVFGYQEAWSEYRYMPDTISGEFRSNYDQSLDVWHWGDYYEELPKLGDKWIDEPKENFERTLAIQDHDQFMGDFYFNAIYTRPMPLYSVPGLIDHH